MSAALLVAGLILLYAVATGKAAALWAALTGKAPDTSSGASSGTTSTSDTSGAPNTASDAALGSANGLPGTPSGFSVRGGDAPTPQERANLPYGNTQLNGSPYMGIGGYS